MLQQHKNDHVLGMLEYHLRPSNHFQLINHTSILTFGQLILSGSTIICSTWKNLLSKINIWQRGLTFYASLECFFLRASFDFLRGSAA